MTIRRITSVAVLCAVAALVAACSDSQMVAQSATPSATVTVTATATVSASPLASRSVEPSESPSTTVSATPTATSAPVAMYCVIKATGAIPYDIYALADHHASYIFYLRKGGDGLNQTQLQSPDWLQWTYVPAGTTDPASSGIRIEGDRWYSVSSFFAIPSHPRWMTYRDLFFTPYTSTWAPLIGHTPTCSF